MLKTCNKNVKICSELTIAMLFPEGDVWKLKLLWKLHRTLLKLHNPSSFLESIGKNSGKICQ